MAPPDTGASIRSTPCAAAVAASAAAPSALMVECTATTVPAEAVDRIRRPLEHGAHLVLVLDHHADHLRRGGDLCRRGRSGPRPCGRRARRPRSARRTPPARRGGPAGGGPWAHTDVAQADEPDRALVIAPPLIAPPPRPSSPGTPRSPSHPSPVRSRLLVAAERHIRRVPDAHVDAEGPGADAPGDPRARSSRPRRTPHQRAVGRVIGDPTRVVVTVVGDDGEHRAEHLFPCDGGGVVEPHDSVGSMK